MKRFLLACVLLVTVLSGTFLLQNRVSASVVRLLDASEPLEDAILLRDATGAQRALDEFHHAWHAQNGWMYLVLAHTEMDDLENAARHLSASLKIKDFESAERSLADIRSDLTSIRERDILSLKNIL